MWQILEPNNIDRLCLKLPPNVVKKYNLWKDIVVSDGPEALREFPGFHDEKLRGQRSGERCSRLSLQYRVIYAVDREVVTVYVLEISPHEY